MSDAAHVALELDESQFRVLNAIVLKKMASVGGVADACALSVDVVTAAMQDLQGHGLVAAAGDSWLPIEEVLQVAIQQSLLGEQTPQEALDEAAAKIEEILERNGFYTDILGRDPAGRGTPFPATS